MEIAITVKQKSGEQFRDLKREYSVIFLLGDHHTPEQLLVVLDASVKVLRDKLITDLKTS